MTQTRKPRKCESCGHKGGALAPKRSEDFDAITDRVGMERQPTLWVCDGPTFAEDGPVECLHRMTSKGGLFR
jgi:hypothetical protein